MIILILLIMMIYEIKGVEWCNSWYLWLQTLCNKKCIPVTEPCVYHANLNASKKKTVVDVSVTKTPFVSCCCADAMIDDNKCCKMEKKGRQWRHEIECLLKQSGDR
ncbi:hypothetical protein QBC37DRAFT_167551 [Rhypophila decipiens]|uniref:Uncharacterized protein n=1 Tax=Rhypophila decipiens TaxID=261697 RepID=A0AAN7BAV5_9PEZI|nr:hypothetical protein QBC37DRAFT_167551 [Rhypophila decipiens]